MQGFTGRIVVAVVLMSTLSVLGSSCGTSGTTSDGTSPTSTASENTPTPTPPSDQWYVRIYNADDVGKAYVNGVLVKRVGPGDDSGWVDITTYVKKTGGKTAIRFTMYNKPEGYTWGFQIAKAPDDPDSVVWTAEEGRSGYVGANGDDQKRTNRIVYDKTVRLRNLPTASPAP